MSNHATPSVTCNVCPHHCHLAAGQRGRCRARRNIAGKVVAEQYGRITSLALDPVEKKPLARFMPGSLVLSVGSYGCNLACPFCQNHEIAQAGARDVPWREIAPDELVRMADELHREDPRVAGIAYTYNEPLVGWEYVRDCAELAHEAGLVNVLVSNGVAEEHVIRTLAPLIDAANIDLKGFDAGDTSGANIYRDLGAGPHSYAAVQRAIELLAACPTCHLEVTTLIVPGMTDHDDTIDAAARWLAALDPAITYHLTRFFPRWRMATHDATPVQQVYHLADVARRHLAHVRCGNC